MKQEFLTRRSPLSERITSQLIKPKYLVKPKFFFSKYTLIFRQWHGVHGNRMSWLVVVEQLTVTSDFGMQTQGPVLAAWTQIVRHVLMQYILDRGSINKERLVTGAETLFNVYQMSKCRGKHSKKYRHSTFGA